MKKFIFIFSLMLGSAMSGSAQTVTTAAVIKISFTSAVSGGTIAATVFPVSGTVTARGVVFGKTNDVTKATGKVTSGSGIGTFASNIIDLTPNTTYFVFAFATTSSGTKFGQAKTFKTLALQPVVTTTAISSITDRSAVSGGNVTSAGSGAVTAKGVCWSILPNPTPALATKTVEGTGTGIFPSNIRGLQAGTIFFVRAYATNQNGTGFGAQLQCTTAVAVPRFIDLQPRPTSTSNENRVLFTVSGSTTTTDSQKKLKSVPTVFCTGHGDGEAFDQIGRTNGYHSTVYKYTGVQLPEVIYKAHNAGDSSVGSFGVELYAQTILGGITGQLVQVDSRIVVGGLSAGATSSSYSYTPPTVDLYDEDHGGGCYVLVDADLKAPFLEAAYLVKVDGGNTAGGGGDVKEKTESNNEGNPMP